MATGPGLSSRASAICSHRPLTCVSTGRGKATREATASPSSRSGNERLEPGEREPRFTAARGGARLGGIFSDLDVRAAFSAGDAAVEQAGVVAVLVLAA